MIIGIPRFCCRWHGISLESEDAIFPLCALESHTHHEAVRLRSVASEVGDALGLYSLVVEVRV